MCFWLKIQQGQSVHANVIDKTWVHLLTAFPLCCVSSGVIAVSWYPPGMKDDNGEPIDDIVAMLMDAAHKYHVKVYTIPTVIQCCRLSSLNGIVLS